MTAAFTTRSFLVSVVAAATLTSVLPVHFWKPANLHFQVRLGSDSEPVAAEAEEDGEDGEEGAKKSKGKVPSPQTAPLAAKLAGKTIARELAKLLSVAKLLKQVC